MDLEQYKLVCARRIAQNNLLWQTPTLASAAQAFLLSSAIGPHAQGVASMVLAMFSVFVGVASLQLMARHRRLETLDSIRLRKFEEDPVNVNKGYSVVHGPIEDQPLPANWLERPIAWLGNRKSATIWMLVLVGFIVIGCFATIRAIWRIAN